MERYGKVNLLDLNHELTITARIAFDEIFHMYADDVEPPRIRVDAFATLLEDCGQWWLAKPAWILSTSTFIFFHLSFQYSLLLLLSVSRQKSAKENKFFPKAHSKNSEM